MMPLSSFQNESLVGHPMPLLANKTLDGKTIDANYYAGHVTVVSFMAIGCMPCMNEINTLNKITEEYAANGNMQVLCVARQMGNQMVQFNGEDKASYFSMVRKALKADPIKYAIQPACDGESKMEVKKDEDGNVNVGLKCECNTLSEKYGISGIPVTFFIDKKGLIRKIESGGPGKPNDPEFYNKLKTEIDLLLAE